MAVATNSIGYLFITRPNHIQEEQVTFHLAKMIPVKPEILSILEKLSFVKNNKSNLELRTETICLIMALPELIGSPQN